MGSWRYEPGETYGNVKVLGIIRDGYKKLRLQCLICGKVYATISGNIKMYNLEKYGCPDCRNKAIRERKEREFEQFAKEEVGKLYGNLEVLNVRKDSIFRCKHSMVATCKCNLCGSVRDYPYTKLKTGEIESCICVWKRNGKKAAEAIKPTLIDGTSIIEIQGSRAKNKNNSSGYRGVSQYKAGACAEKWRAYIHFKRKQYHLGTFDTLEDAVAARKAAEKEVYGNFLDWFKKEHPVEWDKIEKMKKN